LIDMNMNSTIAPSIAEHRADFPILKREVNGIPLVYLDNGASSQKPQVVIDAIEHYYVFENTNIHRGVHTLSQEATQKYEDAREKVRAFLNAEHSEEIILTKGTTDSINLVAASYGKKFLNAGDRVVISAMEHHSNIVPWQLICDDRGAELKVIPMTDSGELDVEAYKALLSPNTKMVAVVHVSNSLGTINPVKEMIAAAHQQNIPVLIDGAQAVPHMAVDVRDLDADFYAFSAHKMFGPTGVGVLYGKKELLNAMPPYQGGGDMIKTVSFEGSTWNDLPHKFEAGTPNIAGGIALGTAIDYINSIGYDAMHAHETELLEYGTAQLLKIEGLILYGTAKNKAGVMSFLIEGLHPYDTAMLLDRKGIAVRTGHHCTQPVMDRFGIDGTIRASLAFYNNKADIDQLIEAIHYAKERLL